MSDRPAVLDVVIPVWNAPENTRRCVDSLYQHASAHLGRVRIEDDASSRETARMLDRLDHPGLDVHHAPENRGFGPSVNAGVAATSASHVLVLNSDTEFPEDCVEPLRRALDQDPDLAAVNPGAGGPEFVHYDFSRYERRGECVTTFDLRGSAFLIRRRAFEGAGGFDSRFRRGYYEDRALSRQLGAAGWHLGVHPESRLFHRGNTSFRMHPEFREIVRRNRELYYRLYPAAARRIAVLTDLRDPKAFPAAARSAMESVMRQGGRVSLLPSEPPRSLMALEMDARPLRAQQILRVLHSDRGRRRWKGLWWIGGSVPAWLRPVLRLAAARGLDTRVWADEAASRRSMARSRQA